MQRFSSLAEAEHVIASEIDQPVIDGKIIVKPGITLEVFPQELYDGRFTNVYDLAFNDHEITPEVVAFDALTSVHEFFVQHGSNLHAATSGGFFFLADHASSSPRELALNLSISEGALRSLPVRDQEAVTAGKEGIGVRQLAALGTLELNGHTVEWSGSLTDYDTEAKIYGNGNVVIAHESDEMTGTARFLDENSRYTPSEIPDDHMDVGFVNRGSNNFIGVEGSRKGGIDIFAHDFVVRCPVKYIEGDSTLEVQTIGGLALSRFDGGGFSAGPMINVADFNIHPINSDPSLGSRPPFIDRPMARSVLYKTTDGKTHFRLYDGRPNSPVFNGVTPREAADLILEVQEVETGCFLDPGQTSKLCIREGEQTASYGNRHYLKWPTPSNRDFIWIPEVGRPVANVIAI